MTVGAMNFGAIFVALNEHPTFTSPVVVVASRENWWIVLSPDCSRNGIGHNAGFETGEGG